jgi:hypothetical protein
MGVVKTIGSQQQVISSDGAYALSSSWDKTLRLWELSTGQTTRRFVGHTNDVLSVSFSADNRQIVSGSRDRTIKLWNTLGDCKYTITDKGHTEWVSCVRFSPNPSNPVIVSAGWDKLVKVSVFCLYPEYRNSMMIQSIVFATSEPTGYENINNHIRTSDAFNSHHISLESKASCAKWLTRYNYRFGSFPPARFKPTTSDTLDTSTPSPSLQMAPSAPPVARTAPPCSGILTSPSTSTPLTPVTRSTPWSSLQTGTGFAPLLLAASSSLISRRRARLMSSSQSTWTWARRAASQSASAWHGAPMARHCSRDILTTRSGLGL